jgi:serine/threonine-protein kinase
MLGNRYEIMEQLGGGGMAIVYKGRDTILNRLVTIKILRPEYTSDEDFVRRFRREAQSVASLSHPNIVSIYDVGTEGEVQYLVMEYIDGENLKTVIKREGAMSPERAVQITRQICDALEHAHENNIVHRDVKPHNILMTKTGRAKLTDFGIAMETGTATMTHTDTIVGSVHYLSPEQARGEPAGPKSDIYSIGVVLFEMLTGTVPFFGDTPISVALKHIQEAPPSPSELRPGGLPLALEQAVRRALEKTVDRRFGSAGEMSRVLENSLREDSGDVTRFIPLDEEATRVIRGEEMKSARQGKPVNKKKLTRGGWLAILVLLGVVIAGGAFAFNILFNVPDVEVPPVEGAKLEDARFILENVGLQVDKREEFHPSVQEGYVIDQDLEPGRLVKKGRVVILTVSKGQDLRTVPSVLNLSTQEAKIKLSEAGFKLNDQFKEDYSDNVPAGKIFKQEPKELSKAPRDFAITVYVSKGQNIQVQVPDLTGMTQEAAAAKLGELKLQVNPDIGSETSVDYLRGQVIAQEPLPNTPVQEGSQVKLTLSDGPGPSVKTVTVTVPEKYIPDDGQDHWVRIEVTDIKGTRNAYVRQHQSGDMVEDKVKYWGKAIIKVFIDDSEIYKWDSSD